MSNNIVSSAVAIQNEANAKAAQQKAGAVITRIQQLRSNVEASNGRISSYRKELVKLATTEVTIDSIVGGPLPTNSNTATITEVINVMNKARQDSVQGASARLSSAIVLEQDSITCANKQLAELVTELQGIQPVVVTESDIVGS